MRIAGFDDPAPAILLYAGNTVLFSLVALRMTALARRDNARGHLLDDSVGLVVLIAASVLAIVTSLVAPRGAMLACLINLADQPLRALLRRRRAGPAP
jgi:ABC-type Fe3+ transport system permease subunit